MKFIEILEEHLGKKAKRILCRCSPGMCRATYANVDDLMKDVGFKPKTDIRYGLKEFVNWYKSFYK